jgi:hypothetical protein
MTDHHDHDEHDHDHEEDGLDLELDAQSRIFLHMRSQNLELLRIAAKVAGFGGGHPPLKSNELRGVLKNIWDIYSEFYPWIDPEETEGGDEDEEG